jgi:hypothetical protein
MGHWQTKFKLVRKSDLIFKVFTCVTPGTPSMNAVPVHQTFISSKTGLSIQFPFVRTVLIHAMPMLEEMHTNSDGYRQY